MGQCASEDAGPSRGVDCNVPVKTLGPQGEWIVRSHIGWRGE